MPSAGEAVLWVRWQVSFQAEVESEETQGTGDLIYDQTCVAEATVENGRESALGGSQEKWNLSLKTEFMPSFLLKYSFPHFGLTGSSSFT